MSPLTGDYLYDNLIVFAPRAEELGAKISVKDVIDFIDQVCLSTVALPGDMCLIDLHS